MASIDEELLQDMEENRREIAFIREQLPSDLKELYSDAQLEWIIDNIATYFYESGILESNDDEVDVDIDEVSDYLCRQTVAEGMPKLQADEVRFVVEADLDFQEANIWLVIRKKEMGDLKKVSHLLFYTCRSESGGKI